MSRSALSLALESGPLMAASDAGATDEKYYDNIEDAVLAVSGLPVGPDAAMRIGTVYSCIHIIAESLAALPIFLYKRTKDGKERVEDAEDPTAQLLHTRPNRWQTPFEFKEMLTAHCALRGNGYAQKVFNGAGTRVIELVPLHPARMQKVEQSKTTGRLFYTYRLSSGETRVFTEDEIFHLRFLTLDGITGVNPITLQREALGLSSIATSFLSKFFGRFARPGGILSHPGKLSPEGRARLRKEWEELHGGSNKAMGTAVLEEGLTWTQVGMKLDDAQFLELRKFQQLEITAMFRVPPSKLGIPEKQSYASVEQSAVEFMTDCMGPWATRWNEALNRDVVVPEDQFAEYNLDALLRADLKSRYDAFAVGLNNGFLSVNEVRATDNRNNIGPEGDDYRVQNVALGAEPANALPPDPRGGKQDPGAPQPKPPRKMGAKSLRARVLKDVSTRIANAEARELPKLKPQTRDYFLKNQHRAYVLRTVLPLMEETTAETVTEAIVDSALQPIDVNEDRQEVIMSILKENV